MGRIILVLAALFSASSMYAYFQDSTAQGSGITLFDTLFDLDIKQVILTADLDSLAANKFSKKEQKSLITVLLQDGTKFTFGTKVSVRGKFRRVKCEFPPLKLNFRKKDLNEMGLHPKRDNYKLVTHCLLADEGESAVLREYLVYEMYQLLTDQSYRVKLFPITYKDVDSDNQISSMAFLIESTKELSRRQGGTVKKDLNPEHKNINPFLFEQVALFQYMIGNRDMDLKILRNILLINDKDSAKMIPIAYDFDMAPFVHAAYAYPQYKDKREIERIYLGFEENRDQLVEVIKLFLDKKEAFIKLIEDFALLSNSDRKECVNYVKAFYQDIENKDFLMSYGSN